MKKFGLIGKKLNYSYSKIIHERLGELLEIDLCYDLIEVDNVLDVDLNSYDGFNVTAPYKRMILPRLKSYDRTVSLVGCCNTIYKGKGYNTDVAGFEYLLTSLSIDVELIKRVVIMGSGATAYMIKSYFHDKECIILSRSLDNYHDDEIIYGDILFNTTPLGMGDLVDEMMIDEKYIDNFKAVIDLNYNPIINKLLYTASKHRIVNAGGMDMLIYQAVKSFEIWNNVHVDPKYIKMIKKELLNITCKGVAIIGMPLSGKSNYFSPMVKNSDAYVDLDDYIEHKVGMSIYEYMNKYGEDKFRDLETQALIDVIKDGKMYISCGGGIITRWENRYILKEFQIINISKSVEVLVKRFKETKNSRPLLSDVKSLEDTYERRYEAYQFFQNMKELVYENPRN